MAAARVAGARRSNKVIQRLLGVPAVSGRGGGCLGKTEARPRNSKERRWVPQSVLRAAVRVAGARGCCLSCRRSPQKLPGATAGAARFAGCHSRCSKVRRSPWMWPELSPEPTKAAEAVAGTRRCRRCKTERRTGDDAGERAKTMHSDHPITVHLSCGSGLGCGSDPVAGSDPPNTDPKTHAIRWAPLGLPSPPPEPSQMPPKLSELTPEPAEVAGFCG